MSRYALAPLASALLLSALSACATTAAQTGVESAKLPPMQKYYNYEFKGLPQKYIPTGSYTANQILDGQTPGRIKPKIFHLTRDTQGFDASRLFHIPPPGIHPRIYFGPSDLPGIRRRLKSTAEGRGFMKYIRHAVAIGLNKRGTWENALFMDLRQGKMRAFTILYNDNSSRLLNYKLLMGSSKGFRKLYGEMKPKPFIMQDGMRIPTHPAERFFLRNALREEMMYDAWLALIDKNARAGRHLADAFTNYMEYLKPLVRKVNAGLYGHDYWRTMRLALGGLGSSVDIANTYDWDYNYMTSAQQAICRSVISDMTKGHYSLGMDLPPHWCNWNFIGMAQYFEVLSLAIEGEKGYDPRVYQRAVQVVRAYLRYALDRQGFAKESPGYSSAGLQHMSSALLAMAGRGENFFTVRRYRRYLDNYCLQTMMPQGKRWIGEGDLADFPPSFEPVAIAHYFYPDDPRLNYVYENLPDVIKQNFSHDYFYDALLCCAAPQPRSKSGAFINYHHGAVFHLPNTCVDPERGWLIARTGWNKNALYMQFTARNDTMDASHNHADAGRIVIDALGIHWTREYMRQIYGPEQSEVLINGVGEGFFPTPATWLGAAHDKVAAFGAANLTYCYNWQWRKQILMWSPNDPRLKSVAYASYKPQIEKFIADGNRAIAQYDPSPAVKRYYAGYLAGDPKMWDQDSWVIRLPWQRVKYAYRTAGLVRGKYPYVMTVDDIQKNSNKQRYTWQMTLNPKVVEFARSQVGGIQTITLAYPAKKFNLDRKFLYVMVLQAAHQKASGRPYVESFNHDNSFGQAETIERLVIPSYSVSPHFKVLIYPFRKGQPLPTAVWKNGHTRLAIHLPGEHDTWKFAPMASGRSHVTFIRNGKVIFSGIKH
jgi:hypothetical protein